MIEAAAPGTQSPEDEAQQEAERELRETEARYRPLLNASPDGIAITDLHGRVLLASRMSARMLACRDTGELVGRPITDFIVAEDREAARERLAQMFEGSVKAGEYRGLRTDGTTFDIEVKGEFIRDVQNRPVQIFFLVRDVTERRMAEEGTTTALREKEALLKEVHHRIKNNLQVITSLLRLESSRSAEPGARRVLKDMQARILSIALLYETLYKSGRFGRVDLAVYIGRLSEQFLRAQTITGPIRLTSSLTAVEVPIDQAMPCGLIVNELLTNAFKHAFPGGRAGEVRVAVLGEEDGRVRLQVSDDGAGLPADFASRRGGSLGLQLVSDLTRQLMGELEIGPASTFTVTFVRKLHSGEIPPFGAAEPSHATGATAPLLAATGTPNPR